MSNYKFKTTNIKGKDYVEVNQRVLYFRNEAKYEGWSIHNEIIAVDSESCIIKCSVLDKEHRLISSAHAQEDRTSSHINKTSYIENCETSAVGRALAMLGIGIETSIASSNEVAMAIAKQDASASVPTAKPSVKPQIKVDEMFNKAMDRMKEVGTKEKYDEIILAIGPGLTADQRNALSKLIKK
jgi:hypothetical protein